MKKLILFALCLCTVMSVTGCSKGDSSSNSDLQSQVEAQQKTIDEQKTTLEDNNDKIERLAAILSEGFGIDNSDDIFADDFNIDDLDYSNEEVHEIYDDTAVVSAYKSGDSTAITDEKDKYILDTATKVIKDNIKDSMTDYEKELTIYNYLNKLVDYDDGKLSAIPSTEDNSFNPYGVLHEHTAICVGNATTFKLFMDMLDIDCKIIHSTEQGEHAWNMICLDDEWYHVDLTFDGGEAGSPAYQCFNVTDDFKDEQGYPWDHDEFPAATATKYNYTIMNSVELDTIYDYPEFIKDAINDKKTAAFLKIKLDDETAAEGLGSAIQEISNQISQKIQPIYVDGGNNYTYNDGYFYSAISIIGLNDTDNDNDNYTDYSFDSTKISNAIDSLF